MKLVEDRQTDRPTDRQTDRPTDRPTDRQTDIATYRAAIAAKKIIMTAQKIKKNNWLQHSSYLS